MKRVEISVKIIGGLGSIRWSANQSDRWVRLKNIPSIEDKKLIKLHIGENLYTNLPTKLDDVRGYEFILKLTNPLILDDYAEESDLSTILIYAKAHNIDGVILDKTVYVLKDKKISFVRYLFSNKEEQYENS